MSLSKDPMSVGAYILACERAEEHAAAMRAKVAELSALIARASINGLVDFSTHRAEMLLKEVSELSAEVRKAVMEANVYADKTDRARLSVIEIR